MKKLLTMIAILGSASAGLAAPTTSIECVVYPASGGEVKLSLPVSFSRTRGRSDSLTIPLNQKYSVTLLATGGDGGEPGSATIEIKSGGKMLHKTLWQAGDSLSQAGQRSGLHYVTENIGEPGGAEVQYVCNSK